MPVPLDDWDTFLSLFDPGGRLDAPVSVVGAALSGRVEVSSDDHWWQVVVDRHVQEIELPPGEIEADDLADHVNARLVHAQLIVDRIEGGGQYRFRVSRREDGNAGTLSVACAPALGFSVTRSAVSQQLECILGAAVRAFFRQGGQRCYLIRMGDPVHLGAGESERIQALANLLSLPNWRDAETLSQLETVYLPPVAGDPCEPAHWQSLQHLLGLPEVTNLCLPDLPELVSLPSQPVGSAENCRHREVFVSCSPEGGHAADREVALWHAPRCEVAGYRVWARLLGHVRRFLDQRVREAFCVASVPLPARGVELGSLLTRELDGRDLPGERLQLVYPWPKTPDAERLPGGVEPPEGVVAGLLAANALREGAFRTIAGRQFADAFDLEGELPETLGRQVSLLVPAVDGIRIGYDMTSSQAAERRPAAVRRLLSLVLRAARQQGASLTFEPQSPATWRAVERNLEALLKAVYVAGALRGRKPEEAYSVTCDHTTMTRNDIDNGRLIARVSFHPALPIEQIAVSLTLSEGRATLAGAAG